MWVINFQFFLSRESCTQVLLESLQSCLTMKNYKGFEIVYLSYFFQFLLAILSIIPDYSNIKYA